MNTTQTNGFLASLLICAFLAITPTYAVDVLFVGGQPNAVQGADPRVLEILQEHFGAENITVVGANQATTDDADGKDLVVLSSTPGSGSIRGKWLDFTGGLINWEEALVDAPRSGNFPFTDGKRTQSDQTNWTVTEVDHFITEGFEAGASVAMFEPAARIWAFANDDSSDDTLVLATDGGGTGGTLAVVEQGGVLLDDVVSAGRRVMWGMTDEAPNAFSADGVALFKRSLDWAAGNDGPALADTDGDGMPDEYEDANGLDSTNAGDRDTDLDGDGLSNFTEFERETKPNAKDSDEDGLDDNVETNLNVWVSAQDTGTHPLRPDTDMDGLLDGVETNTGTFVSESDTGTHPLLVDTDGDGGNDGLEVRGDSDPHDATSLVSAIFGGASFTTTHVANLESEILDIATAKSVLAGDEGDRITVQAPFIHFHDNADAPVLHELSSAYPLWNEDYVGRSAEGPGNHDNHAIFSTGNIFIKKAGFITFVCNSDDGFSLEVDGVELGSEGNRSRENTVMTVELTEGVHRIDFWHYENAAGAGVSLYVYRGTDQEPPALNAGDYELLQAVDVFDVVTVDSDGDDMDDFAETFFFEGLDRDGSGDFDEDGLNDREELAVSTFPNQSDTDGDGLNDGSEVKEHLSDPLRADTDRDTLTDGREVNELNTDPTKADTDEDTFDDNIELALGTVPSDAGSKPNAIVAVAPGDWNDPETWSNGIAPEPGKHYVALGNVAGRISSGRETFRGDSLTLVGPDMVLELDHDGDAVANLILDNASVRVGKSNSLGGALDIRGEIQVDLGSHALTLNSRLTGGGNLSFQGGNSIESSGSVVLNGEGTTFGGQLEIIGTDLAGQSDGSLGSGSVLLINGGLTYGYDYSSDLSRIQIRGDNFRLALDGAVEVADLVGVDATGSVIFSLIDLGGLGPYTASGLLDAFELEQGVTGEQTLSLLGTGADTDGDGLRDSFENDKLGGLDATAGGDPDGDGLTNLAEQSGGTDPNVPDLVVTEKIPQLVVHYDFDEGSGETIHNAAGPNGTLANAHGGAWVESGGVRGSGYLNFNNTTGHGADAQHILTGLMPEDAGLLGDGAEYTMMAWTRFATTAPGGDDEDGMIFGQFGENVLHHGARGDQYHMGHWDNDLTAGSVELDEWHHVAWRYKEGNLEIFVDGESIGTDAKLGFPDPSEIIIGATRSDQDRDFSGDLDDVRVYDGAVSKAEIAAVVAFKPRSGGSIAGLLGYWPEEYVTTDSDHRELGVLPVLTANSGFTWSFWVNAEETGTSDVILGNRFGADGFNLFPQEWIKFTPTRFEWRHADSDHIRNDLTLMPTGVWSHNLVVQDGTTLTYYRDGVVIGTNDITGFPVNELPLFLGGQPASDGTTTEGFSGTLREVAVFGRALSEEEVTEVYTRGLNDQSLGTVGIDPNPAEPSAVLSGVGFDANGVFGFDLPENATGDIEYSTDLENWEVIATGIEGIFEEADATRREAPAGYYRAK